MTFALSHNNNAGLGFEQKLWAAADKLRGHVDPSEYKHLVLGLIFLKYISDTFESKCQALLQEGPAPEGNIFWVPPHARWEHLLRHSGKNNIGALLDEAMQSIERENPVLKDMLPHDFSRQGLDKRQLAGLIELISTIPLVDSTAQNRDILGRVYEYFIGHFASLEGRGKGEFYTPPSIVKLMVEMIEPYRGKIYDPCCGSGGMFIQSEKFVLAHGGNASDIRIFGQESNYTTWRLCKMNLAIRGFSGDIGQQNADCFHQDLHKSLKADYVMANPPFNISDWGGEQLADDPRWRYGNPPTGNANYAWIQHILHHLSKEGTAAIILANAAMTSRQSGQNDIRKKLIDADVVDCVLSLPSQLFYSTPISACIWLLTHNKHSAQHRSRAKEILFINAQSFGSITERTQRMFSAEDIHALSSLYRNWRSKTPDEPYKNIAGRCYAATAKEIAHEGYTLSPSRYVGNDAPLHNATGSLQKIKELERQLHEKCLKRAALEQQVMASLQRFFHA